MKVTEKNLCEYFRLLIRLGRIEVQGVSQWAEDMLSKSETSPLWAIRIASANSLQLSEIDALLESVPGIVSDDLPRKMVVAQIRSDWLLSRISDEDLIREWYILYPDYPDSQDTMHAAAIWQYLDEVLLSFYSGDKILIRIEDARAHLTCLLNAYAKFELSKQ